MEYETAITLNYTNAICVGKDLFFQEIRFIEFCGMPVWLSFRNKVQARYIPSIKADIRFAAQGVIKMPTSILQKYLSIGSS